MSTIDRRQVLTSAVLGGAALVGASSLGPIGPEAAHAHEPIDLDAPDPNFFEGRITTVNGSKLTILDSENVIGLIRVTDATSIWKLTPTTLAAVEVGDGLYARGVQLEDGSLAAESIWVNIVNLHVEVLSIRAGVLELAHGESHLTGNVVSGVTAMQGQNNDPSRRSASSFTTADLSTLRAGSHVQIIGAWRPDTNEVDIATIYIDQ
ncbi:MAG: cell wall protein [Micromonosporaceae bacterium]